MPPIVFIKSNNMEKMVLQEIIKLDWKQN